MLEKGAFQANLQMSCKTLILRPIASMKTIEFATSTGQAPAADLTRDVLASQKQLADLTSRLRVAEALLAKHGGRLDKGETGLAATPVWEMRRVYLPGSNYHTGGGHVERDVNFGKPVLEAYAVPVVQHWAYNGAGPLYKGSRGVQELYCGLHPRILPENNHVVRTLVDFHMTDMLHGSGNGGIAFVVFARTR